MPKAVYADFKRMQLRSSLKLNGYNEEISESKCSQLSIALKNFKTIAFAGMFDRYAEVDFDVLIIGDDILLNLISAIALNKSSKKVLICRHSDSGERLPQCISELADYRHRFISSHICKIIEQMLKISFSSYDFNSVIKELCGRISEIEAERSEMMTLTSADFDLHLSCVARVGDAHEHVFAISESRIIKSLDTWNNPSYMLNKLFYKANNNKKLSKLSKPFLLINAKEILVTSASGLPARDIELMGACSIGGAKAEIQDLKTFGINQRIIDVVSAACVDSLLHKEAAAQNLTKLWELQLNEKSKLSVSG